MAKFGFDLTHLEKASEHFNIDNENNAELSAFVRSLAEKEEQAEEKLNPSAVILQDIKARAQALGSP